LLCGKLEGGSGRGHHFLNYRFDRRSNHGAVSVAHSPWLSRRSVFACGYRAASAVAEQPATPLARRAPLRSISSRVSSGPLAAKAIPILMQKHF
jgi:hypothetical protein